MAKSKQIAKLLKADISMTSNLAQIAKMLEKKGRGGDTILAHITRKEAEMLKDMGGAGTVNPETGLLEFYDGEGFEATGTDTFIGTDQTASPGQTYEYVPSTPSELADYTAPGQFDYSLPTPQGYYGIQPSTPAAVSGGVGEGIAATPEQFQVGVQAPTPTAYGLGARPADEVKAPTPQEKSFLDKLTTQDMIRLGLAGGLAAYGGVQAKKGGEQAKQLAEQQRALAAPYQAQGRELVRAAQAGELTPTGQQSMQALQARLAQGVESRGGVGAQQAAAQAEAFRQQLLQQQYDYGLKVTSIGDNIALGAIKTGMQADQQLQQASMNFYTNLAAIAGGVPVSRS